MKNLRKVIIDVRIPVFNWWSNTKEMTHQKQVITLISVKWKNFLRTFWWTFCVFVTYFNPFLSKKCFFSVETNCLGQKPTTLRKYILIRKAFLNGREMFILTFGNMSEWLSQNGKTEISCRVGISLCYIVWKSASTSQTRILSGKWHLKIWTNPWNTSARWPQYKKIKYSYESL